MDLIDLARLNQVPQNTPATKKRRNVLVNWAAFSFILTFRRKARIKSTELENHFTHLDSPLWSPRQNNMRGSSGGSVLGTAVAQFEQIEVGEKVLAGAQENRADSDMQLVD